MLDIIKNILGGKGGHAHAHGKDGECCHHDHGGAAKPAKTGGSCATTTAPAEEDHTKPKDGCCGGHCH